MSESTVNKPNGKPNPAHRPRPRRKGGGKRRRRVFDAAFKLRVLEEIDAALLSGDVTVGEILRREGLYSSHVTAWRHQRDEGVLTALSRKRGPKPEPDKALRREMAKLEAENEQLRSRLAKAEAIIDVQKKVASLLSGFEPKTGSDS